MVSRFIKWQFFIHKTKRPVGLDDPQPALQSDCIHEVSEDESEDNNIGQFGYDNDDNHKRPRGDHDHDDFFQDIDIAADVEHTTSHDHDNAILGDDVIIPPETETHRSSNRSNTRTSSSSSHETPLMLPPPPPPSAASSSRPRRASNVREQSRAPVMERGDGSASFWNPSTVWVGNISFIERTDQKVPYLVLNCLKVHRILPDSHC